MDDTPIDCTIRVGGRRIDSLEGATLDQVERACRASQPFDEATKAQILQIALEGRRVHLSECPGTLYLTGRRCMLVAASANEARRNEFRSATSV